MLHWCQQWPQVNSARSRASSVITVDTSSADTLQPLQFPDPTYGLRSWASEDTPISPYASEPPIKATRALGSLGTDLEVFVCSATARASAPPGEQPAYGSSPP